MLDCGNHLRCSFLMAEVQGRRRLPTAPQREQDHSAWRGCLWGVDSVCPSEHAWQAPIVRPLTGTSRLSQVDSEIFLPVLIEFWLLFLSLRKQPTGNIYWLRNRATPSKSVPSSSFWHQKNMPMRKSLVAYKNSNFGALEMNLFWRNCNVIQSFGTMSLWSFTLNVSLSSVSTLLHSCNHATWQGNLSSLQVLIRGQSLMQHKLTLWCCWGLFGLVVGKGTGKNLQENWKLWKQQSRCQFMRIGQSKKYLSGNNYYYFFFLTQTSSFITRKQLFGQESWFKTNNALTLKVTIKGLPMWLGVLVQNEGAYVIYLILNDKIKVLKSYWEILVGCGN